jgi:phage shock protein B
MEHVLIVAIVFGALFIAPLLFLFGIVLLVGRLRGGGLSRKGRQEEAEAARMIQEIHQGLARMEERIETLESILIEQQEREVPS